jgi:hypothetical protein
VGDGILTYFGYPQAREDDAERAANGKHRRSARSSPAVTEGFDTPDMVEAKTLINTLQA